MKIKDDILLWKQKINELDEKIKKMATDALDIKEQVQELVTINKKICDAILSLLRVQAGD